MRYHLRLTRTAKTKKLMITDVGKDMEKLGSSHTAGGMQNGVTLWKIVWWFLKKAKYGTATCPATLLLSRFPNKNPCTHKKF